MKNYISKNYLPYITGIKGYAALAIFTTHSLCYSSCGKPIDTFVRNLPFAVVVFFFISSYTIVMSLDKTSTFNYIIYLKRRFSRIAPLYYIVCIILFICPYLGQGSYYQDKMGVLPYDIWNLIHHLLFTNGIVAKYQNTLIASEWIIPIEWSYYLILPLFVLIRKWKGIIYPLLLIIGLYISINYLYIYVPLTYGKVFDQLWRVERYFIVFLFGAIFYYLPMVRKKISYTSHIVISGILSIIGITISSFMIYTHSYAFERFIFPFLLVLIMYLLFAKPFILKNIKNKVIREFIMNIDMLVLLFLFPLYIVMPIALGSIFVSILSGIVLLACSYRSVITRFVFENPIIVFIGTISYSIYILHLSILYLLPINPDYKFWVGLPITIIISALSYKFIEQPGFRVFQKAFSGIS
jgi:peptidoglycan/LPS O-acetylase OafA/YrhL